MEGKVIRLEVRIEPRTTHLYAAVGGVFKLHEAKEISLQILESCIQHGFTKILIDVCSVEGPISTVERYNYAVFMSTQIHKLTATGKAKNIYLAYVGNSIIDPARFGQLVAANRGIIMKATTDFEEAYQWLGIESPKTE